MQDLKITDKRPTLKNRKNQQGGFLELIVVIIIALVLLHVLGINIQTVLAQPWVKEFAQYIIYLLKIVWSDLVQIFAFVKDLAIQQPSAGN